LDVWVGDEVGEEEQVVGGDQETELIEGLQKGLLRGLEGPKEGQVKGDGQAVQGEELNLQEGVAVQEHA
jgi:hypothetical protein